MSNYTYFKEWDEITFPFPNFSGCTVEVWGWMSYFIPHFTGISLLIHVGHFEFIHVNKGVPDLLCFQRVWSLIYVFNTFSKMYWTHHYDTDIKANKGIKTKFVGHHVRWYIPQHWEWSWVVHVMYKRSKSWALLIIPHVLRDWIRITGSS